MQYDAVTLDTNVFHRHSFNLEGGMLGQLSQFKLGSAKFVLSEIVSREVFKYLKIEAKEAKDALSNALRKASRNAILSAEGLDALTAAEASALSIEDSATKRLVEFIFATGLTTIPAHQADMTELVRRYFGPLPPFEDSAKKKNEFPDAIALLSLEAWAKAEGKKILAISQDQGWKDFAKVSDFIDVEPDLGSALQVLQEHTEQAKVQVASLLRLIDSGELDDLHREIIARLETAVDQLEVEADANSGDRFETDGATLSFEEMSFVEADDDYKFNIINTGKDRIVAKISLSIQAKAQADFIFYIWDSVDQEELQWGNTSAEQQAEFEVSALVTFEGDFSAAHPVVNVTDLELVDTYAYVDFGEINPNIEGDEPDYNDEDSDAVLD